jgi:hypothetical protein
MKELLEKLKLLDPATYKRYDETELAEYEYDDENGSMVGYIYQENLIDSAKMAWLQACLQDAIRAHSWTMRLSVYPSTVIRPEGDTVVICNLTERDEKLISSATEYGYARSILAAYIAACEANP